MAQQLNLLGMTAILTILIWVSADSLVNDTGSVTLALDMVTPPGVPNMIVDPASRSATCEVQVAGPRRTVEIVQAQAPWRVRFVLPELSTGTSPVSLDRAVLKRQLTERWAEFRKLTVVSVQPLEVTVHIDHWMEHEVGLVMKRLTLPYEVEPQLQRSSVTVRMRESRFAQWPPGEPLQIDISADLERLIKDQSAGQSVSVPVALDPRPFGAEAEITPNTVHVTATVKAERTVAQIPTVPVLVAVSFSNLENSVRAVTPDGAPLSLVTQTITVTGPTDEVTRLAKGVTRAYGIVHLKQQDLEQLNVPKLIKPEYQLPPGLSLADDPPPIEFKLVKVNPAEKK